MWVGNVPVVANEPVPLALLPEGCSLHRLACLTLKQHQQPYFIRHITSGVRGLQMALVAGLGIGCLNQSAVPTELNNVEATNLPELPQAEFFLLQGPDDDSCKAKTCAAFSEILKSTLSGRMN